MSQKVLISFNSFALRIIEHGEGLQVLHYEIGQKYEPHFDYFLDEFNTKNGGQRMATLLMYLYVNFLPQILLNNWSVLWLQTFCESENTMFVIR